MVFSESGLQSGMRNVAMAVLTFLWVGYEGVERKHIAK